LETGSIEAPEVLLRHGLHPVILRSVDRGADGSICSAREPSPGAAGGLEVSDQRVDAAAERWWRGAEGRANIMAGVEQRSERNESEGEMSIDQLIRGTRSNFRTKTEWLRGRTSAGVRGICSTSPTPSACNRLHHNPA